MLYNNTKCNIKLKKDALYDMIIQNDTYLILHSNMRCLILQM